MVETENKDEPVLPSKRKLGPLPISEDNEEEENQSNKYQKLQFLTNNDIIAPNEKNAIPSINSGSNFSVAEEENGRKAQAETNAVGEVDEEEEEEDADDGTDFEDEEEEENRKAASLADRKGKGIMIKEEDDDSDDDDSDNSSDDNDSDNSSDGRSEAESDCDELEDDPLAEVDLDNILPSRTRRKAVYPGFYIANDLGNNQHDDSDA